MLINFGREEEEEEDKPPLSKKVLQIYNGS